jgi:predicted nucleotidyltransferase
MPMYPSSPELSQIRPRLEAVFPDRLRGVLLFGSVARREADPESDVDLLILLDGPIRLGPDLRTIVQALYPLQLDSDRPIHALPVAADDFAAGLYALYRNAKAEGVFL